MNKYDNLRILKKTQARTNHKCYNCGGLINPGDFYYAEKLKDVFLHTLHNKKFCSDCYKKYGDNLLSKKGSGAFLYRKRGQEPFYKSKN